MLYNGNIQLRTELIYLIKIAICDDCPEELEMLSCLLERYRHQKQPTLQVQTFQNGFSLLSAIDNGESFDAVILDILMPGENGMNIAREIRKDDNEIKIIFLTSSPEYAVESYEIKADNYLLKPLSEEKLFSVMDNCLEHIGQTKTSGFLIHSGTNRYTRILYSNLMYGEAMRKSVNLHLADHTIISSVMTFTELTGLLDTNPDFLKPHRSYIVNMNYIENITKTEIILMNGDRIPIPKNHFSEVSKIFLNFAFSNSFE